jgi:aminoglycoside 6'-N-acetyltransferase
VTYGFRRATVPDLPMIGQWLKTPEVVRWWGDPDEQYALIEGDLADPAMRLWIVSLDDRPFAYIQDYDPRDWGVAELADLPPGARGIDQFIGEPEMIGRGHGSAFIRAHVDRLLADDAPLIFTDPDPENRRAVRAYEKAGFEQIGVRDLANGPAALMVRHNHH